MILIDQYGHLVTDSDLDELHEFAKKLGLKRSWFQISGNQIFHYDLTTARKREQALALGAIFVDGREVVRRAIRKENDQVR